VLRGEEYPFEHSKRPARRFWVLGAIHVGRRAAHRVSPARSATARATQRSKMTDGIVVEK
jgi:hypothetical protein